MADNVFFFVGGVGLAEGTREIIWRHELERSMSSFQPCAWADWFVCVCDQCGRPGLYTPSDGDLGDEADTRKLPMFMSEKYAPADFCTVDHLWREIFSDVTTVILEDPCVRELCHYFIFENVPGALLDQARWRNHVYHLEP